jgi:hypothetical protein
MRPKTIDGLLTADTDTRAMGFCTKHVISLLAAAFAFSSLPYADAGGCGGSCGVSVGGGSSYNFMGDPAFNIGMSSFDEFVRDNLGQTTLSAKSLSQENTLSTNSLNQTSNDNASQNSSEVLPVINKLGNATSDNGTVELGAAGVQDKRYLIWSLLLSITSSR